MLHVKQRCLVPQTGEGGGANVVQTLALDDVETVSLKLSVIQYIYSVATEQNMMVIWQNLHTVECVFISQLASEDALIWAAWLQAIPEFCSQNKHFIKNKSKCSSLS